jgi:hypothetical protein
MEVHLRFDLHINVTLDLYEEDLPLDYFAKDSNFDMRDLNVLITLISQNKLVLHEAFYTGISEIIQD